MRDAGRIPTIPTTRRARWADLLVPAGLVLAIGLLLWVVSVCTANLAKVGV